MRARSRIRPPACVQWHGGSPLRFVGWTSLGVADLTDAGLSLRRQARVLSRRLEVRVARESDCLGAVGVSVPR